MEEPKVDLNQVVVACLKQLQALQASKKQTSGRDPYLRG